MTPEQAVGIIMWSVVATAFAFILVDLVFFIHPEIFGPILMLMIFLGVIGAIIKDRQVASPVASPKRAAILKDVYGNCIELDASLGDRALRIRTVPCP